MTAASRVATAAGMSSGLGPDSSGGLGGDGKQDAKAALVEGWGDDDDNMNLEDLVLDEEEQKARSRLSASKRAASSKVSSTARSTLASLSSNRTASDNDHAAATDESMKGGVDDEKWDDFEESIHKQHPAVNPKPVRSAAGRSAGGSGGRPRSVGGSMKLGAQKLGAQKLSAQFLDLE
jgi:hypothetical protein